MHEVFSLELSKLGYIRMLEEVVAENDLSYEQILDRFNGQLGTEAKAMLRVLIDHKTGH